jgi:serine/threonine protein kinase
MTRQEIEMLFRLKHSSISFYMAAFITPLCASVYVEFCDRGSLENLIKAFATHRKDAQRVGAEKPEMPERFIWHAFATLCDGLAFLMGGRTYLSNDVTNYDPAPGWVPILHRDMKPDNVLLRSRTTLGTKKYFYCVLSDFGLACEDWPEGHQKEDPFQRWQGGRSVGKIGTRHYYAPELLYDPYPRTEDDECYFPAGQRHSAKSDLWSLAAAIYNLADCGPTMLRDGPTTSAFAHITSTQPRGLDSSLFLEGTISRKYPLDISALNVKKKYSNELRDAILLGTRWDLMKRPNPIEMVKVLKILMEQSGFTTHVPEGAHDEELPSWATKVHDFHSLPPLDPKKFGN